MIRLKKKFAARKRVKFITKRKYWKLTKNIRKRVRYLKFKFKGIKVNLKVITKTRQRNIRHKLRPFYKKRKKVLIVKQYN